jgi:hypothetical protein
MTPHSGPASNGQADHPTRYYPGAIITTDAITRGHEQLLEAMSAISEDRSSARWAGDLASTLHAEGGIWETLGRAVGWPTGNYDAWTWVTWEEAARA